jgi:hypothetical protein
VAGDDDSGAPEETETGLAGRVDKLETGQDTISAKLDHLIERLSGGGGAAGGAKSGEGESVADEIARQLAERDARARADADSRTLLDRLGAVETSVSEMREKAPGPLQTRRARVMWGRE